MKPKKSIIYSFLIGGNLALIAQAILSLWQLLLEGTAMEFFSGGATLVSLGLIGCVLGGFAAYQYVEEWADFGALLCFSGFAMAVGMKAVTPWTTQNERFGKCVWNCVWFVIWFNILFGAICVAIGYICAATGIDGHPFVEIEATTGGMRFFWSFIVGGFLSAFFQVVYIIVLKITPKVNHLHILITAWMLGCILAPTGICTFLTNLGGEGFSAMITVGGYNMYNVGIGLFAGETSEALVHLGSFALAVTGLAVTALFTFFIYNANFGRTTVREVHKQKALVSLEELGFEAELTDVKAAEAEVKPAVLEQDVDTEKASSEKIDAD